MVRFRCKASGNYVQFENEDDIAWMRKEDGYEEVIEQKEPEHAVQIEEGPQAAEEIVVMKKRAGRPRKMEMSAKID